MQSMVTNIQSEMYFSLIILDCLVPTMLVTFKMPDFGQRKESRKQDLILYLHHVWQFLIIHNGADIIKVWVNRILLFNNTGKPLLKVFKMYQLEK